MLDPNQLMLFRLWTRRFGFAWSTAPLLIGFPEEAELASGVDGVQQVLADVAGRPQAGPGAVVDLRRVVAGSVGGYSSHDAIGGTAPVGRKARTCGAPDVVALAEHFPTTFPLIDYGREHAYAACTRQHTGPVAVTPWPCAVFTATRDGRTGDHPAPGRAPSKASPEEPAQAAAPPPDQPKTP